MKKCYAVLTVLWLFAACMFGKEVQVRTEEFLFKGDPMLLEEIKNPVSIGDRTSLPMTNRWYRDHRDAQIVDLSPIIKGEKLFGWNVSWVEKPNPSGVSAGYVEAEAPFTVADKASLDAVLQAMWKNVSKGMLGYRTKPICLNMTSRDGITTVYGMWFMMNSDSRLLYRADGSVSMLTPKEDHKRYQDAGRVTNNGKTAMPQSVPGLAVVAKPERVPNEGEVVVMAPFKAIPDTIVLQPVLNKDLTLHHFLIASIVKGSPFDKAGLKTGMIVTHLQGIAAIGFTQAEFDYCMSQSPDKGWIEVSVLAKNGLTTDYKVDLRSRSEIAANTSGQ